MSHKTTNCMLKMQANGVEQVVYCTTMGRGQKIKSVVFKSESHKNLLKKAIAAYNRLDLHITINNEQFWFDVIKYDRNIPINELKL